MKFLRLCLWLLIAAFSASPLLAQQTLTPEQQKQVADALRKALDQPPAAAPVAPPAETPPPKPSIPAKPAASPAVKAPLVSAPPAVTPAPHAPVSQTLPADQSAAAREALRRALDQPTAPAPAAPVVTKSVPPAETKAAEQSNADAKAKADAEKKRLAEEEKRAMEQQKQAEARRQTEQQRAAAKATAAAAPVAAPSPAEPAAPALPAGQSAAAREALRRALDQAASPAPSNVAPKASAAAEVKPTAPTPAPVVQTSPAIVSESKAAPVVAIAPSEPVAPALPAGQSAAARDALRRALDQPPGAAPSNVAPKLPATAEVKAAVPPAVPAETKTPEITSEELPSLPPKEAAAARAALRSKMDQFQDNGLPALPLGPVVESSLPQSKAQRLAELLSLYRADQISPAEYHSQRAKVLAEPIK